MEETPLDISDEVLQMHKDISHHGTYDYMICKCNNDRLVIEHIEHFPRNSIDEPFYQAYMYEDFTRTLTRKRDFRYGIVVYCTDTANNSLRKIIAVAWFPTYESKRKFEHAALILKEVLVADLYLETFSESRLSRVCIESKLTKLTDLNAL